MREKWPKMMSKLPYPKRHLRDESGGRIRGDVYVDLEVVVVAMKGHAEALVGQQCWLGRHRLANHEVAFDDLGDQLEPGLEVVGVRIALNELLEGGMWPKASQMMSR